MDLQKSDKVVPNDPPNMYYPRVEHKTPYVTKYTAGGADYKANFSEKDYEKYQEILRGRIASGYYPKYDDNLYSKEYSSETPKHEVSQVDAAYSRWVSILMKIGLTCKLDGENLCIMNGGVGSTKINVAFNVLYSKEDFKCFFGALDHLFDPIGSLTSEVERSSLDIFFDSNHSANTFYSVIVALKFIA